MKKALSRSGIAGQYLAFFRRRGVELICMNPECSGKSKWIEVHHIVPIAKGGSNTLSNLILLCHDCHRGKGLHGDPRNREIELSTFKCYTELDLLGFVLEDGATSEREVKYEHENLQEGGKEANHHD